MSKRQSTPGMRSANLSEIQGTVVVIITPTFTANFQTNFGANAAAAMAAWAAAAKRFTDAFSDEIHINITVDAVTKPGVFGRSFPGTVTIAYDDLFEQMSAHASTQNDVTAIGPGKLYDGRRSHRWRGNLGVDARAGQGTWPYS